MLKISMIGYDLGEKAWIVFVAMESGILPEALLYLSTSDVDWVRQTSNVACRFILFSPWKQNLDTDMLRRSVAMVAVLPALS